MGQGAESCGGYEIDYDPYGGIESDNFSVWSGKDCDYLVSRMSVRHMKNAIRLCEKMMRAASFSCDEEKWREWIDVFENEIRCRPPRADRGATTPKGVCSGVPKTEKKLTRGAKKEVTCHCGTKFLARVADIKRGWGKSCSKSCSANARS